MKTYRKLGLQMVREEGSGWRVQGAKGVYYVGTGNKGAVMHEFLLQWNQVHLVKGQGWVRNEEK